jgi:hypothetical protein
MSDYLPPADEPETLQLRRPTPPGPAAQRPTTLPGPLDLTQAGGVRAGDVPAADETSVLPLDALLEPAPVLEPPAPIIAPPVSPETSAPPRARPVSDQMRADVVEQWRGMRLATRRWVGYGDNKLIVATVAVLLLLLVAVSVG